MNLGSIAAGRSIFAGVGAVFLFTAKAIDAGLWLGAGLWCIPRQATFAVSATHLNEVARAASVVEFAGVIASFFLSALIVAAGITRQTSVASAPLCAPFLAAYTGLNLFAQTARCADRANVLAARLRAVAVDTKEAVGTLDRSGPLRAGVACAWTAHRDPPGCAPLFASLALINTVLSIVGVVVGVVVGVSFDAEAVEALGVGRAGKNLFTEASAIVDPEQLLTATSFGVKLLVAALLGAARCGRWLGDANLPLGARLYSPLKAACLEVLLANHKARLATVGDAQGAGVLTGALTFGAVHPAQSHPSQ